MGYYTYHNFILFETDGKKLIDDEDERSVKALKKFREISEEADYVLEEDCWVATDSSKWYNLDDEMIELSKEFPDILFCVEGDGDESDDRWMAWYLNGKTYTVYLISIPPFDSKLLNYPPKNDSDELLKD